ncbi:helicase associated domain-containing protein [Kitasatospora sp. NPDC101155]|uniref:helicase associated domain-containing protein n=1 Tax=Kitasatospora sp. NPDC101155 TaxID=3364097 RepID=UPI00380DEC3F
MVTELGASRRWRWEVELISWLTRQRHLNGQGLLDAARVSELDALGMIWSKLANAWERGYAYAKAFHHQHGHLAIPATAKLDDYAVGAWMRRQRKTENLTTDQATKLDALDEPWRLEPDWNRSYRRLLAYLAAGGTLTGPANRTGGEADPAFRPGIWLRKQDKSGHLHRPTAAGIDLPADGRGAAHAVPTADVPNTTPREAAK